MAVFEPSAQAVIIHPLTLAVLQQNGYETKRLRSKSWDEFSSSDSSPIDAVITVCDNAAGEVCPIWPGHPVTAHWGFEDPVAFAGSGSETRERFEEVFRQIESRVKKLAAIELDQQKGPSFQQQLRELGKGPKGPS